MFSSWNIFTCCIFLIVHGLGELPMLLDNNIIEIYYNLHFADVVFLKCLIQSLSIGVIKKAQVNVLID